MRSSLGQQREHVKILAQKYSLYITVDSPVITVDDIYNCRFARIYYLFIYLFISNLFIVENLGS